MGQRVATVVAEGGRGGGAGRWINSSFSCARKHTLSVAGEHRRDYGRDFVNTTERRVLFCTEKVAFSLR